MAKRRMLSQTILYDEEFNSLSIQAQNIFYRMLTITDDCGIIPANPFTLKSMLNLPNEINGDFETYVKELINKGLIIYVDYNDKQFYFFKKESFEEYQSYLIRNRTKSEYLKISVEEYEELYNQKIKKENKIIIKEKSLKVKNNKENFLNVLLEIFKEKYKKNKGIIYVESKQDLKHLALLLSKMKKQFPEYDTEEMRRLFEILFDKCTAITDDKFLSQITIPFLNSQLNKYLNYIKNGNKATNTKGNEFRVDYEKYKRLFEKI